jgi:hypothetical protein
MHHSLALGISRWLHLLSIETVIAHFLFVALVVCVRRLYFFPSQHIASLKIRMLGMESLLYA